MNQKEKYEKEILFEVYKKEIIEEGIVKGETPDFIITDPVTNKQIGVEITRIYTCDASATLRESPDDFKDRIIDNHQPNSKRKVKKSKRFQKINISKVIDGGGYVYKDHIIWHQSTLTEFFSFFQKKVRVKSKDYVGCKEFEFVNLIAKDEENYFKPHGLEVGEIYGLIREAELFDTVICSSFQEIFFISEFKTGTFIIPLKWLVFRSEFELYQKFWQGYDRIKEHEKDDIFMMLSNFCICLIHLGYENVYFASDEEFTYIIFGVSYWKINLNTKDIEEKEFLALDLSKAFNAKMRFKSYNSYKYLFEEYLSFRKTLCVSFDESYFRRSLDN